MRNMICLQRQQAREQTYKGIIGKQQDSALLVPVLIEVVGIDELVEAVPSFVIDPMAYP